MKRYVAVILTVDTDGRPDGDGFDASFVDPGQHDIEAALLAAEKLVKEMRALKLDMRRYSKETS